jgi:CRP/FNR family transcriptional regulator, cyclic AMP receptor protein
LNVASDSNVLRIGFIMTDSSRIDNRRRARERLISILLDLSHQYGQRKEERIELSIDLSHEDLAGFVGSSRESVSLEISRLRKEGLIVSARRRLALCDLERRLALNQQ